MIIRSAIPPVPSLVEPASIVLRWIVDRERTPGRLAHELGIDDDTAYRVLVEVNRRRFSRLGKTR